MDAGYIFVLINVSFLTLDIAIEIKVAVIAFLHDFIFVNPLSSVG